MTTIAIPAPAGAIDLQAAETAASAFLAALGVSTDSESTSLTPRRMAVAFAELLSPPPFEATTFPNDAGHHELVLVAGINFSSLCAHHLLPFTGVAHVGYLPGERILGLSKFARLVDALARRPQVQEELTQQVARWLVSHLAPAGVGVVILATHLCMTCRGARAHNTVTVTNAWSGALHDGHEARTDFLAHIQLAGQVVGQPGEEGPS
ncbi:GTP cyclohydrolase I [Catellatospora citrea]|uniref:GTP cyclohydrolase I n=1 Tax=Catellatospora citrea TaxID=53366 RepID=UPI0033FF63BA